MGGAQWEAGGGAGGEHQHYPLIHCELIIVLVCVVV